MANEQQLELLRQGVQSWNDWRLSNKQAEVDLRRAPLVGMDLREANLTGADLSNAHLGGAYLDRAQLGGATLRACKLFRAHMGGVVLKAADMENADLGGAHLSGADLSDAILRGAKLRGTNLYGAQLTGSDFKGALLGRTIFGNVDLSAVKGLEQVEHVEPSTIGLDTYIKSATNIPKAFLLGAGIPEHWIQRLLTP